MKPTTKSLVLDALICVFVATGLTACWSLVHSQPVPPPNTIFSPPYTYRLYWGTSPHLYSTGLDLGYTTNTTVTNLPSGPIYAALAVANRQGIESDYSPEVVSTGSVMVLQWDLPATPPLTNIDDLVFSVQVSTNLTTWVTTSNLVALSLTNATGRAAYYRFYGGLTNRLQ